MKNRIPDEELVNRLIDVSGQLAMPRDVGFAASILRQSARPGWMPSKKQATAMRRIITVAEKEGKDDIGPLIDWSDTLH